MLLSGFVRYAGIIASYNHMALEDSEAFIRSILGDK